MKRHFNEFIEMEGDYIYLDTETSGLDVTRYRVWSVQLGDGKNATIIVQPHGEEAIEYIKKQVNGKTVVCHNAKFDLQALWKLGVPVGKVWCTRLVEDSGRQGSNYDPSLKGTLRKYGIAEMSKQVRGDFYLDVNGKPSEETGLPTVFELDEFRWTDERIDYAFDDIIHLPQLLKAQKAFIAKEGIEELVKLENAYAKVAAGIEYAGVAMDLQAALIFQADMERIRDEKAAIVVPELEGHYFKAAREQYAVNRRIYDEWSAKYALVKNATNKGEEWRQGGRLTEKAKAERDRILKLKPFQNPKEPTVFNLNSNKQLLTALLEAGVDIETTGKNELLEKSVEHPVLQRLLDYRKYEKLSSMVESQAKLASDGRIHPHINQIIATGRQSMSNPNLQQCPSKSDEGKRFRSLFVAAPGMKFVSADFSAIELVIAGVLSEDESLIYAVHHEADLHAYTIGKILDVPTELLVRARKGKEPITESEKAKLDKAREWFDTRFYLPDLVAKPTIKQWIDTLRDYIKTITYGLIYGLTVFGLMERFHCDMETAERFTKLFFEVYPKLREKIEHDGFYAEELMRTPPTPIGRFRRFIRPEYPTRQQALKLLAVGEYTNEEREYLADQKFRELQKIYRSQINRIKRQSGNFAMQATSADITKYSSVLFEKKYPVPFSPVRLVLSIHDELVVECPAEMAAQVAADLKQAMEEAAAFILDVENLVVVDTTISDFWKK